MKHLLKIIVISLLLINIQAKAQDSPYFAQLYAWNNLHNGWSVLPNNQGNYMIFGSTYTDNWRGYAAEIDSFGNFIQAQDFPFQANENTNGYSLKHTIITDYGFFSVGGTGYNEIHYNNALYLMSDTLGNLIKIDTIGPANQGTYGLGAAQNSNEEYLVIGYIDSDEQLDTYPYLIKLGENGTEIWDTVYTNFLPNGRFYDIETAKDGSGYFLSAEAGVQGSSTQSDAHIIKIDEEGNILLHKEIEIEHNDMPPPMAYQAREVRIVATEDGGVLVTFGSFWGGSVMRHFSVYKLDADFDEEWSFSEEFAEIGVILQTVETEEGNFVCVGSWDNPFTGDNELQLFSISPDGTPQWRRKYDVGTDHDYGYSLHTTFDGGFIAAGRSEGAGMASLLVVKTNCVGVITMPIADFSGNINHESLSITTENESELVYTQNGGFYVWDLGNGTQIANEENINYQYEQAGEYHVTLSAILCQDTSTYQQTVCVGLPFATDTTFSHQILDIGELQFQSPYHANDIVWDFGDNTNSTAVNPIHNYTANGIYEVHLSFTLCGEAFSFTETINIDGVGISENNNDSLADKITLFPNPASDFLQIETDIFPKKEAVTISIFNVLGEKVLTQDFSNEIDISALPVGSYFLQFENENQTIVKRFVINR